MAFVTRNNILTDNGSSLISSTPNLSTSTGYVRGKLVIIVHAAKDLVDHAEKHYISIRLSAMKWRSCDVNGSQSPSFEHTFTIHLDNEPSEILSVSIYKIGILKSDKVGKMSITIASLLEKQGKKWFQIVDTDHHKTAGMLSMTIHFEPGQHCSNTGFDSAMSPGNSPMTSPQVSPSPSNRSINITSTPINNNGRTLPLPVSTLSYSPGSPSSTSPPSISVLEGAIMEGVPNQPGTPSHGHAHHAHVHHQQQHQRHAQEALQHVQQPAVPHPHTPHYSSSTAPASFTSQHAPPPNYPHTPSSSYEPPPPAYDDSNTPSNTLSHHTPSYTPPSPTVAKPVYTPPPQPAYAPNTPSFSSQPVYRPPNNSNVAQAATYNVQQPRAQAATYDSRAQAATYNNHAQARAYNTLPAYQPPPSSTPAYTPPSNGLPSYTPPPSSSSLPTYAPPPSSASSLPVYTPPPNQSYPQQASYNFQPKGVQPKTASNTLPVSSQQPYYQHNPNQPNQPKYL